MEKRWLCCLVIIAASDIVYGQQNAGKSVASALQECYNTTELLDRDRRLPSTINVLIDLVRKAENGRSTQDARQLSIEIIHRFRQDGILRSSTIVNTDISLPFSPRGLQANKNRLLLTDFIPGTAVLFPNETLNALERCSLHHMLSSVVDTTQRGDETTVCNALGRYQRRTRSADNDAEFDPYNLQIRSNMEEEPATGEEAENSEMPEVPAEEPPPTNDDAEILPSDANARSTTTVVTSACPVEDGVVYTRWGAVQAGTVIAGIAAGLEPQSITEGTYVIDNRFAVTLSGDIAEAAVFQAGSLGAVQSVGVNGGWNSTLLPRWYFIQQDNYFEMTDADIRGGLDGLIIAQNVRSWTNSFSSLKISQILDMYYSRRGVFNDTIRACNRLNLLTTVAPLDTLQTQTSGFAVMFDNRAILPGTLRDDVIPAIASTTVNMFLAYAPTISDLSCANTAARNRVGTDIIIVLDAQWPYSTVGPAIGYLLDNLDINPFESNFTIINGNDGSIIVNRSNTILDYHQRFNLTVLQQHATGFQYSRMYNQVEQIVRDRMDEDRVRGNVGGRSTIALFMPYQTAVTSDDNTFATERLDLHRSFIPDLRILVLGGGSKDSYSSLVTNQNFDIFTLSTTTVASTITAAIDPLVSRILELPRRIINPHCGSLFNGTDGTASMDFFLEPQTTNFYRIAPNYFYGEGARTLRIRGLSYGTFTACMSRLDSAPAQNSTASDINCRSITANEETFTLTDFCNDGRIRDCNSVFLSVQSTTVNANYRCSDTGCRFPDNIKFTVTVDNFACRSGSIAMTASITLIAILFFILRL